MNSSIIAANATTNATTTTAMNVTELNFAGKVLTLVCQGNTKEDIILASESHMDPIGLMLTTSLAVAAFALAPVLKKLVHRLALLFFDLNRDGKVDGQDTQYCLDKRCGGSGCCKSWNKKATDSRASSTSKDGNGSVLPLHNGVSAEISEDGNRADVELGLAVQGQKEQKVNDSHDIEEGNSTTGQGKNDDPEQKGNGAKDENDEEEPAKVDIGQSDTEALDEMVGNDGSGNEDMDELFAEAKEEGDHVLTGWMNIVFTFLFFYSSVAYMAVLGPSNVTVGIGA